MRAWSSPVAPLVAFLFIAGAMAGCLGNDDALDESNEDVMLDTDALSTHLYNLSEIDESIELLDAIVEPYRIEALDGALMDTWIIRPDVDGPVPVILEITPYYGGGNPIEIARLVRDSGISDTVEEATGGLDVAELLTFIFRVADEMVPRGYAVGISSVRGTGNSEGCFTQGGPTEAEDSGAVIEAIAAQPWSNGNVGLIGVSYPGTTPQDVWVEAPSNLKTIVPISGISDMYKYNFVNGVHIDIQGFGFNTYYWPMTSIAPTGLALGVGAQDPVSYAQSVPGEACNDQVDVQEGGVSSTLDGNKDDYWQVRDFGSEARSSWDLNPERASVFYIHGLQDWNVKPHMMEDWLPLISESGVAHKIWIGQWSHNWPQREDWWNTTMVAWFDQFLKDKDTGILDAPVIQVQSDDGVWRHEATWPPMDAELRVLGLDADGALTTDLDNDGSLSFHDRSGWIHEQVPFAAMPKDAVDDATMDVPYELVWRSEPVAERWTIAGLPRFEADVTATGDRASLLLTLAREDKDGDLYAFNFAAQSLNHAHDLENGKDSIAGETVRVNVSFFPQDDVLQEGERLVLIASGKLHRTHHGPTLQAVADGSEIAIDLATALLEVPVDTTVAAEAPQPCWEGWERDDNDERIPGTCYWLR